MTRSNDSSDIAPIIGGDGWIPFFFDSGHVRYVSASRDDIARASFLDDRFLQDCRTVELPPDAVRRHIAGASSPPEPIYLFHTAHTAA